MVMSPAPSVMGALTDFVVPAKTLTVYGKILKVFYGTAFFKSRDSGTPVNRLLTFSRRHREGGAFVSAGDNGPFLRAVLPSTGLSQRTG